MKLIYVLLHLLLPIVNCDTCNLVINEDFIKYNLSISSSKSNYKLTNAFDKNVMSFVQTDCSTQISTTDCTRKEGLLFLDNTYHWFLIELPVKREVFTLIKSVTVTPARPKGTERCVFPWSYPPKYPQIYNSCGNADESNPWCSFTKKYVSGSGQYKYCETTTPDGSRTNDIEIMLASELDKIPNVSIGYRNFNWTTFELCGKTDNNLLNSKRIVECSIPKYPKYVALRRSQLTTDDKLCCLEFAEIELQIYKGSEMKVSSYNWTENSKRIEFIDSGCEFPTVYKLQIRWNFINFFNQSKILNVTNSKYEIKDPSRSDAGRYFYEYLNANGVVIYQSPVTNYIYVNHKISSLKMESLENFIFIENVSYIDISCKTDEGFPFPTGVINLMEINSSSSNLSNVNEFGGLSTSFRLFTKAERRFNNQIATCLVKQNNFENKTESIIQILWKGVINNIKFSHELAIEGDDFKMSCEISDYGNPRVNISIEKVGGETVSKSTLHFPTIHANQTGTYICHISNAVAQFSTARVLNIAFVRWTIMPITRVEKNLNDSLIFNITSVLTDFYPNDFNLSCWHNSTLILDRHFLTSDKLNFELHLSNMSFAGIYSCFLDHIFYKSRNMTGAQYLIDLDIRMKDVSSSSQLSLAVGVGVGIVLLLILLFLTAIFIKCRTISTSATNTTSSLSVKIEEKSEVPADENDTELCYISARQNDLQLKNTNEAFYQTVRNLKMDAVGNNLIPLYCALMGILIVGLVIFVIIKHWQRRQQCVKSKPLLLGDGTKQLTCRMWAPVKIELRNEAPTVDYRLEGDLVSAATSTRRFINVPEAVKRRLEIGLNVEFSVASNWKCLAKQLGFQEVDIVSFESQASEEYVPACRCLLERWGASPLSTVGALSRALHKINRRDLILLLREERCANQHQEFETVLDDEKLCSV